MVKVIGQQAASPAHMDGSVVFARWRQCALHLTLHMLPRTHPSPQPKRHLDRFSHFCTADGRVKSGMPRHILPLKLRLGMGPSGQPSNAWFLGTTRILNSNGILIGLAAVAQLAAECPCTLQWATFSLQSCPFPWRNLDPHLTHDSLDPSEPTIQTASLLVQPFLHSSPLSGPILHNGPRLLPSKLPLPMGI